MNSSFCIYSMRFSSLRRLPFCTLRVGVMWVTADPVIPFISEPGPEADGRWAGWLWKEPPCRKLLRGIDAAESVNLVVSIGCSGRNGSVKGVSYRRWSRLAGGRLNHERSNVSIGGGSGNSCGGIVD